MMASPTLRAALWDALRPLVWGWGAVLSILALLLAALYWWVGQQTQQLQGLLSQRDAAVAQLEQIRRDHDLALQHRQIYAVWLREGLISDEPLATWRALQMQKILDWLGTQAEWLQSGIQLELQPAQPWSAAQEPGQERAPAAQDAAGEGASALPPPSAQILRISGQRMHDIEAWSAVHEIQRLLGSSAALQRCLFKTDRGRRDGAGGASLTDSAVPQLEWECQWTLFHIPRTPLAAAAGGQP